MNGQPLIVGAGPTGLAAALFLKRRGIPCRIIDQSPEPAKESRALAVNPRTLEILDTVGLAPAFEAQARPIHRGCFYHGWEPIADFDFAGVHPRFSMCVIPQATSERLLAEALAAEGVRPERRAPRRADPAEWRCAGGADPSRWALGNGWVAAGARGRRRP